MIKVGITGGIGSGKSVVCSIFSQLGVSVYSSDVEAKKIYEDPVIMDQVRKIFGDQIIDKKGKVDKKQLSKLVFQNAGLLKKLNDLMHPTVKENFQKWLRQRENERYILKEAAILFESGTNKGLDRVITVSAPAELRVKRTVERDKASEELVLKIMKNQMSEEEKVRRSDFVIVNDEDQLLIPQVLKVHKTLIAEAGG